MTMPEQILYRYARMELKQFDTCTTGCEDDEQLELSTAFRFSYLFDDDTVCCSASIAISSPKAAVLSAVLNSYFKIHYDSVAAISGDDCITLPPSLLSQLASLSYGSMRGVIYAKAMGTPLEKIILPPTDLQDLFTKPVKFKKPSDPQRH